MKITRHNCEAYMLDHHEGRLSPAESAELLAFLEEHADLKELFESFENIALETEEVSFNDKDSLKRSQISDLTSQFSFEELCIADVEGDITYLQKRQLNSWIGSNPRLKKELELYRKTKLVPDHVKFEHKLLLKKQLQTSNFKLRTFYIAAAASILLVLGLFFLLRKNEVKPPAEIAQHKTGPKAEAPVQANDRKGINLVSNTRSINAKQRPHILIMKNTPNRNVQNEKIETQEPEKNNLVENNPEIPKEEKVESPKQEEPVLANNNSENPAVPDEVKPSEPMTLGQLAAREIKTKLLADELSVQELKPENAKKFRLWDTALLVAKGIRKLTGKKVEMKQDVSENNEVLASSISIGKISFQRTYAQK